MPDRPQSAPSLPTSRCTTERHAEYGGACPECCSRCNYGMHTCHFCGADLTHDSFEIVAGEKRRHWLSDCRPDLIDGTYNSDGKGFPDGPMTS